MTEKKIIEGDAHSALSDAITDLLHVYDGDELTVGEVEYECWKVGRMNYHAEVAHEDDVYVTVERIEE